MSARERAVVRADIEGRRVAAGLVAEVRLARLERGLSLRAVGRSVGLSASQVSRIERGDGRSLTFPAAVALLAAVGLRLHVRAYPSAAAIRDAGQLALLARLKSRVSPTLSWRTEVPLAIAGDLRAWDATIAGTDWAVAVEAETRVRDVQALLRRLGLKQRDAGLESVVLLVAESGHNRAVIRDNRALLSASFPTSPRDALRRLALGLHPGGSVLLVL